MTDKKVIVTEKRTATLWIDCDSLHAFLELPKNIKLVPNIPLNRTVKKEQGMPLNVATKRIGIVILLPKGFIVNSKDLDKGFTLESFKERLTIDH